MKALIFAAGLGTRLRPLTATTPKPLLHVGGKPLLQWHIERLVSAGIHDIIINSAWLAEAIDQYVSGAPVRGARLQVSFEPDGPYDTGGAIRHVRAQLGEQPFLAIAGDIWTLMPFEPLLERGLKDHELGCLALVPNPVQHPGGDFCRHSNGVLSRESTGEWFTYSGISLLRAALIDRFDEQCFPLREPLRQAAEQGALAGEVWRGDWEDVGTIERYQALNARLAVSAAVRSDRSGA